MDNNIRSLRGLLRKMVFAAPGLTRVGGRGMNCDDLAKAAGAEGLSLDPLEPEGWIEWSPEATVEEPRIPGKSLRVLLVTSQGAAPLTPLPNLLSDHPARTVTTLRKWVATWWMGHWLRPFLAPDAVGARTCKARIPGARERVFVREKPAASANSDRLNELAVTALGVGFVPIMPATLVCILMLPVAMGIFWWLCPAALNGIAFLVGAAATVGSVALEKWAGARFLTPDPREFVLDEVAGMSFVWALLPFGAPWWAVVAGFFLFRLFDIFKWGVSWIEHFPIPGTIVWDDLLAGLYAGLIVIALCAIFPA